MDITEYITDVDLCNIYLDNCDSDELEDFVSFLNRSGYNKDKVIEVFSDYETFYELFNIFLLILS